MPSIIQQSFSVSLRAMRFFFLYPPDKHKTLYRICTHVMYFVFIVPFPSLQFLNLVLQENLDFSQIADNVFLLAEIMCFLPKLYPFLGNSERIKKCIHYFDGAFFEVVRTEHEEILKQCMKMCRGTAILFLVAVTGAYISWSTRPISWKNHIFPVDLWMPYDVKTAPVTYIVGTYLYILAAAAYGAYTSGVIDPLIAGLAYQATSQIKILKHKLQFLSEHIIDEVGKNTKLDAKGLNKLMYEKIRKCIIHHNLILEFVTEYEHCFSQMAFSQFVAAIIVICVSCLQLTLVDLLSLDCLAMVMYLITMLSEIYLYCYFGTLLYEESNTITDAIYLGKWYEYDVKCRKALILLMERAKKPMLVKCGHKIVDMSLDTFSMILRRSYSLLAVLESFNE
ncbi:hypothetical protein Zmor_002405 [Zophobas morio]|uniref:Odorant receptor n=1 Tax=Zophobas morio TaxID=2755281 RepID=A0AA38J6E1_9CUCU|nr:hypothetical protein Zmor_002405 [Zophobas morio]